jgi:hypothetical protein
MPPDHAQAPIAQFPSPTGSDPETAQRRLALLTNWRSGVFATATVMAGLLPLAIAWRDSYVIAISTSIIFAGIVAIGTHVARRRRLQAMALWPELFRLPDLAVERRRLQSARTRRALGAGLRRTAQPIQSPGRFDPCPVLVDRVAPIRNELLKLANDLEQTQTPNPACVALIRELLTNGSSPLYNRNLPAADLYRNLASARAGITAQSTT